MEKFYRAAASSMNYFFLRATFKGLDVTGYIREELESFLNALAECEKIPESFYQDVKRELEEGYYLEEFSESEIMDRFATMIKWITGDVDENLYNFYTYVAGEVKEKIQQS